MSNAIAKMKLSLIPLAFGLLLGVSGCAGKGGACCGKAMADKKPGHSCCAEKKCGEKKCGCEKCKKCKKGGEEKASCSK